MHIRKPHKNYLDMIPVRNVKEFIEEGEKITLLIPKFRRKWMRQWFIPSGRSENFRIHLDEMGSKVWHLIDGERTTEEICNLFNPEVPELKDIPDAAEWQVTKFLTQLYSNRFILFK
jgi:hypothetical protein